MMILLSQKRKSQGEHLTEVISFVIPAKAGI
jgi:hypothetical protein